MTKTDFAELKEKLGKFDGHKSQASMPRLYEHIDRVDLWITAQQKQHTKSTAIISELIEIIKLQSVTIDSICTTHSDDCTDADEEFSEDETCECGYISIVNNKKETTTRLQKLRDGK